MQSISKRFFSKTISYNKNAGILAMEVYFPNQYVDQTKLEVHDKVSQGKYTIGLGQEKMAFVNAKREDTASICMTAVHNLLEKYNIPKKKIGRLEVGTETPLDKSKSIKSYVTQIFEKEGITDLEGADVIHACYGGTSAVLNAAYWLEAREKIDEEEKYAIVVAGDISTYNETAARPSGGAGAVAMLLGLDAPLQFNLKHKASHMTHAYDFYKPIPTSPYPLVDGKFSNSCYLSAVDHCYDGLRAKLGPSTGVDHYDFFTFHSPYNKLVQKSIGRLFYNDFLSNNDSAKEVLAKLPQEEQARVLQLLKTPREKTYFDADVDKTFTKLAAAIYKAKVYPSTLLGKNLGNNYTASLYCSLASLVYNEGEKLIGKKILNFSYGSGSNSTIFELQGKATSNDNFSLSNIKQVLNLESRLAKRKEASVDEYERTLQSNLQAYNSFNYVSTEAIDSLEKGAYYLSKVDEKWRRTYEQK